jgi:hypothetical protein
MEELIVFIVTQVIHFLAEEYVHFFL